MYLFYQILGGDVTFSFTLAGKKGKVYTIKEYKKKDDSKAYMFVAYLGVDPLTGKQKRTTRRGFKTKRDAKIAKARLQAEIEEKIFSIAPKQMTFQKVYNVWLPVYNTTIKEKVSTKYNKMSSDYTYFQNLIR